MTKLCSFSIFLIWANWGYTQSHDKSISTIRTVEAAREYAARFNEVSFDIVNYEQDVFLFDNVDLDNLPGSVGKLRTLFQRRTKFLKDTVITMLDVQTIEFDYETLGMDSVSVLRKTMMAEYNAGATYWDLKKKYEGPHCFFSSGPESTDALFQRFGSGMEDRKKGEIFRWDRGGRADFPLLIIIHREAHPVPAFYAISYNVAG